MDSLLLLVAAVLSPPGREGLGNMFSSEQLSRSIAQFVAMLYLGGLLVVAAFEFAVRLLLIRRARRQAIASKSE